jgi:uncharacterized protein (TIGR03083 family)
VGESVHIWRTSIDDFLTLVQALDDSEWARPTPCPGWTVSDVVAHVIDLEGHFIGDERPNHQPDWGNMPHVSTDMQQFVEIGVDARRGRTPTQLLDELREVVTRRDAQLRDAEPDQSVQWFVGELSLERLLWMRTFDIWTHEQDIRTAVGRPGGIDTAGAQVAWDRIRETLPYIWGKKVGSTQTLSIVVTPPGPSGTFTLALDGEHVAYNDSATPDVRVEMSWTELAARAAGRIPPDQVSAVITGDPDLARRFLEQLAFTP